MKLFLISAAAAALVFASPAAFAQDHHEHGGNHGGDHHGASHTAAPAKPAKPAAAPHVATPKATTQRAGTGHTTSGSWAAAHGVKVKTTASPGAVYNNAVRNNNRDNAVRNKNRQPNWRGNAQRGNGNNNLNNNRNNDNHGSWQGRFNRRNVTASHHYRYRGNSWNWPSGYRYQRWSFGMTLPSIFWAQNYWISDYSNYGLGYPPPGTVWVRYNDDAILIDRGTGEILEVVYDQFD